MGPISPNGQILESNLVTFQQLTRALTVFFDFAHDPSIRRGALAG